MKKKFLYRPGMTQVEAKMGRFMREGENHAMGGPGGPGIQIQQPNNAPAQGGNPASESGVAPSESNNAGETFDPSTFWDSPQEENGSAPSGESAGTTTPSGGNGEQGGFAQQLATQLEAMTFGDPIFTPEIAEEINQGNFAGFEKRVQAQMQQAVRQALSLNVQIMRPLADQIMEKMRAEFGGTLSERDNESALIKDFPAAKNPQVAPIIKGIFDQAMVKAKGDRAKAVAMTKQMVAFMANTTADDLDLNIAPRGAGDSRPPQPTTNWLDELTGR